MADLEGTFYDDSGQARLEGRLNVPAGVSADSVNGVAINNTPAQEGLLLGTVDGANCAWQGFIIDAAVPVAAPTSTQLPIAVDTTAVSGGIYVWDGAAWTKAATI